PTWDRPILGKSPDGLHLQRVAQFLRLIHHQRCHRTRRYVVGQYQGFPHFLPPTAPPRSNHPSRRETAPAGIPGTTEQRQKCPTLPQYARFADHTIPGCPPRAHHRGSKSSPGAVVYLVRAAKELAVLVAARKKDGYHQSFCPR